MFREPRSSSTLLLQPVWGLVLVVSVWSPCSTWLGLLISAEELKDCQVVISTPSGGLGVLGLYGPHHLLPEAALWNSAEALETTAFFYKQETGTRKGFCTQEDPRDPAWFQPSIFFETQEKVAREKQ